VKGRELVRRFLRRELDELVVYRRDLFSSPSPRLEACRLLASSTADPAVRVVETAAPWDPTGRKTGALKVVRRFVETGFGISEWMVVEGLTLLEHEGLGGLPIAINLGGELDGPHLEIIVRREDAHRIPEVAAWLDGLLDANHPFRGRLLRLQGDGLGFLPPGNVRHEDLVMPDATLRELERNFGFLLGRRRPKTLRHRSVLLAGVPGTGKTLLCRWLAGTVQGTVLWVTPGVLQEVGGARPAKIARRLRPCLVILEDLDVALGTAEEDGPAEENLMDAAGFSTLQDVEGVGVVATTNHPELLRGSQGVWGGTAGFDALILVEPPDGPGRERLLRRLVAASPVLPPDAARIIPRIAAQLEGATGAELTELVRTMEYRWIWEIHRGRTPDIGEIAGSVHGPDAAGGHRRTSRPARHRGRIPTEEAAASRLRNDERNDAEKGGGT